MMHHLHIVAFDIPYPANYGGAIDVFYKLAALKKAGVNVVLHCTYKGKLVHYPQLESLCQKVYYYKRDMSFRNQLSVLPYAVKGRIIPELLDNLLADEEPVLFEGLVSCYYLSHPLLKNRHKFFRECNIEHDYYRALAKATTSLKNKIYYYLESVKLKHFEPVITNADMVFAVSHQDEEHYKQTYKQLPVRYLPSFHQHNEITTATGQGGYVLYHGNLALAENDKAARYICENIVSAMPDIKFVFAGRQPSASLQRLIGSHNNASLVANPDDIKMQQLVTDAHIHFLITHQPTGLKLKLLNVLYSGRYVITNSLMTCGTELSRLCVQADTPAEQIQCIREFMGRPFTADILAERKRLLSLLFDNSAHCNDLVGTINSVIEDTNQTTK